MRLTFDIPDEQHEVLVRCIPHGWRKHTYRALIQRFVEQLEEDPAAVMKDLITKHLDIAALTMKGMENGSNQRTNQTTDTTREGKA